MRLKTLFVSIVLTIVTKMSIFAQTGSLDLSFSVDGKVNTPVANYDAYGKDIAIQSDGKILVAGYSHFGFTVIRYNDDGTLDSSFDSDGIAYTLIGSSTAFGYSIAIQNDSKILVGGYCFNQGNNKQFALVRYNSDGTLDNSFNTMGYVRTDFGLSDDFGSSIAIQNDNKILVAGSSYNDFAVVRYNYDGTLDTTFSLDGMVTTDFNNSVELCNSICIQNDGKILLAGRILIGNKNNFGVVRYNIDGTLDQTFDYDGKMTLAIGNSSSEANSIICLSNGKIIVAGYTNNGINNRDFAMARLNNDGSLDLSFATNGTVVTDFGSGHYDDYINSITIQDDGKILAVGHEDYWGIALARYTVEGELDTSFNSDGKTYANFDYKPTFGSAIAIQNNGKIVVGGYMHNGTNYEFAVVRFNSINLGIEDNNTKIAIIYPNPSTATINFIGISNCEVEIISIHGKIIKTFFLSQKLTTIDLSDLSSGVYTFLVHYKNEVIAKKIIKL